MALSGVALDFLLGRLTVAGKHETASLELLDQIPVHDGDEVVVTISEARPAKDIDACGELRCPERPRRCRYLYR
jgi:hypothetical protein